MVAKMWTLVSCIGALALGGCAASTKSPSQPPVDIEAVTTERAAELERRFSELLNRLGVVTAGAAIIRAVAGGTGFW